jgi:SAM-dependent methyltransferase
MLWEWGKMPDIVIKMTFRLARLKSLHSFQYACSNIEKLFHYLPQCHRLIWFHLDKSCQKIDHFDLSQLFHAIFYCHVFRHNLVIVIPKHFVEIYAILFCLISINTFLVHRGLVVFSVITVISRHCQTLNPFLFYWVVQFLTNLKTFFSISWKKSLLNIDFICFSTLNFAPMINVINYFDPRYKFSKTHFGCIITLWSSIYQHTIFNISTFPC